MSQVRYSRVLRLVAILFPALIAGLAGRLPVPAVVGAGPAIISFDSTWNGISDTNWNNAFNWTPNSVPSNLSFCFIPGGRPHYPLIHSNEDGQCNDLTIESGGELDLSQASLEVSNALIVSGTLNVSNDPVLTVGDLIAVEPGGLLILDSTGPSFPHFTSNGLLSVSGTVRVQALVGLDGAGMSGPNPPTQTANLLVNPGGLMDIDDSNNPTPHGFTLDGSVTNHGTLRQTLLVSSTTRFLSITSAYLGAVIIPSAAMGSTNVAVQGGQTCSGQPQSIRRCYVITPTNSVASTVQFFYVSSEANGNALPSVFQFGGLFGWLPYQSTRGGAAPNLFAQAAGITFYATPFELKNVSTSFLPLVRK